MTVTFGRNKFLPWGIDNGNYGSPNEFYIKKATGEIDGPYGVYPRYKLNKNDVVQLITGTGGGYGNPRNRPAAQVASDVKNGYFSKEEAETFFYVQVDETDYSYEELPKRNS